MLKKDEEGFIEISEFIQEPDDNNYIFVYNGKKYYFKSCSTNMHDRFLTRYGLIYRELLASELAADYEISHVNYYPACKRLDKGLISEDFVKDSTYLSMSEILKSVYTPEFKNDNSLSGRWTAIEYNNLIDIYEAIKIKYKDANLVNKLMMQIIDIFIFDELLANDDRHFYNFGILEGELDINVAPIFDNAKIISKDVIESDRVYLTVSKSKSNNNELLSFLELNSDYANYIKSKLWVISEENILNAFERIEKKNDIIIPEYFKKQCKNQLELNANRIVNVLSIFSKKVLTY